MWDIKKYCYQVRRSYLACIIWTMWDIKDGVCQHGYKSWLLYYLNHVGYKALFNQTYLSKTCISIIWTMWAIKNLGGALPWQVSLGGYYLNHVGYKDTSSYFLICNIPWYYLNHVGYKVFPLSAPCVCSLSIIWTMWDIKEQSLDCDIDTFVEVLSEPCGI